MRSSSRKTVIFKRGWMYTLLLFITFQTYYIIVETTGWGFPMRDIKISFLKNIIESEIFKTYFTFYEVPWHNIVTVVFGLITISHIIFGVINNIRKK